MSLPEMDNVLEVYLGDRYSADDWVEPRHLLFSGDEDNAKSLENLTVLRKMYFPDPPAKSSRTDVGLSKPQVKKSQRLSKAAYKYILHEAEEEEEEEEEEGDEVSGRSLKSMCLPGPSATQRLAATFDHMATQFEQNPHTSSQGTTTEYIAEHLWKRSFPVIVSVWIAGQLYMVADSPKTIAEALPLSLYLAVKDYIHIMDKEREAVERSWSEFPYPAWVRVKKDKYRGDLALVFEQLPSGVVSGSRALIQRSRLPNNNTMSDIIYDDEIVGWKYKGESYYKGLLLKTFPHERLELISSPHVDDISLFLDSGWDKPFLKKTMVAFSKQFLHVGDCVRVVEGSLKALFSESSVCLESSLDGRLKDFEVQLQDIECVFCVGDAVRVVAGPHLGLEGHIIQMCEDTFHICQAVTNEQIEVSKYYLDRHLLSFTLKSQLPMEQNFKLPESDSTIQIGDYIEVLRGPHTGKRGVVDWIVKGDTNLWFRNILTTDTEPNDGLGTIFVPVAFVQRMDLTKTLSFTKEKGYDVRPGDIVIVTCGLEYEAKGVIQSIDFPNAHLTLRYHGDYSLVTVLIAFVAKVCNIDLDRFKKDIGQEVYIIAGDWKGYRVTLRSFGVKTCIVAPYGQTYIELDLCDVVTRYGVRLNGAMLEGQELASFCDMRKRSVWSTWPRSPGGLNLSQDLSLDTNPSSSTLQAWSVDQLDIQDSNDALADTIKDSGPIPWLKEFSSTFFKYHTMLKVSPVFDGLLSKQFVSTTCPDPFFGENGPAPEGCIAAFCTSNSAGAAMKHYHIPAIYLSPAPPRKKNQECFILDGPHCGLIQPLSSCSIKNSNININITPMVTVSLHFDQICLVEPIRSQ
ncbi:hypothetical protein EDD22DRAFT_853049 [Suillus occidentalis]|nr:hypothetical protein EDD22DRAFT_853049 [Suillus occidentalis]